MLEQTLETGTEDLVGQQHVEHLGSKTLARMRFDLRWQSSIASHTDTLVSGKVNMWRDIFPPELEARLMGQPVGHRASHDFGLGELLTAWRDDRLKSIRNKQFDRRFMGCGMVQPRTGRFYPLGILQGVDGVFQMDRHPFRMAQTEEDRLVVDLNHPLADKPVSLDVQIEEIRNIAYARRVKKFVPQVY